MIGNQSQFSVKQIPVVSKKFVGKIQENRESDNSKRVGLSFNKLNPLVRVGSSAERKSTTKNYDSHKFNQTESSFLQNHNHNRHKNNEEKDESFHNDIQLRSIEGIPPEQQLKPNEIKKMNLSKNASFLFYIDHDSNTYQFPLEIQTLLYHGRMKMYVSLQKQPTNQNFDYCFEEFHVFPSIDYTNEIERSKGGQSAKILRIHFNIFAVSNTQFTIKPFLTKRILTLAFHEQKHCKSQQNKEHLAEQDRMLYMFQRENTTIQMTLLPRLLSSNNSPQKEPSRNLIEQPKRIIVSPARNQVILQKQQHNYKLNPQEMKEKGELKRIRNMFAREKVNREITNTLFLKSIVKKELELDTYRPVRINQELQTLKAQFQNSWLRILSFLLLLKAIHLKYQIKKKHNTLAEIFLQRIVNAILLLKKDVILLGNTPQQRSITCCQLGLKMKFAHLGQRSMLKAEKQIASFLQEFGFANELFSKILALSQNTSKIQSCYRDYQLRKHEQILQLCDLWEVAQNDLHGCEMACFGKGYIDKMIFSSKKEMLEDMRYFKLKELLEEQLRSMQDSYAIYYTQFKPLRRTDKILITFLNHMEASLLRNDVSKKIQAQYFEENGLRSTAEFFLHSLANIQKFNLYVLKDPSVGAGNLSLKINRKQSKVFTGFNIFSQDRQTLFQTDPKSNKNQVLIQQNSMQALKKSKTKRDNFISSGNKKPLQQFLQQGTKNKPQTDQLARLLFLVSSGEKNPRKTVFGKKTEENEQNNNYDQQSDSSSTEIPISAVVQNQQKVLSFYFSKPYLNYMIELNQMQLLVCKQLYNILHPNNGNNYKHH